MLDIQNVKALLLLSEQHHHLSLRILKHHIFGRSFQLLSLEIQYILAKFIHLSPFCTENLQSLQLGIFISVFQGTEPISLPQLLLLSSPQKIDLLLSKSKQVRFEGNKCSLIILNFLNFYCGRVILGSDDDGMGVGYVLQNFLPFWIFEGVFFLSEDILSPCEVGDCFCDEGGSILAILMWGLDEELAFGDAICVLGGSKDQLFIFHQVHFVSVVEREEAVSDDLDVAFDGLASRNVLPNQLDQTACFYLRWLCTQLSVLLRSGGYLLQLLIFLLFLFFRLPLLFLLHSWAYILLHQLRNVVGAARATGTVWGIQIENRELIRIVLVSLSHQFPHRRQRRRNF